MAQRGVAALKALLPWCAALAAVAALHAPFADLPFANDGLAYVIANAKWMRETGSLLHPADHDPGHPPLVFWQLAAAWSALGIHPFATRLQQWMWAALLVLGGWRLGRAAGRSREAAFAGAAGMALCPPLFALSDTIELEIPLVAAFVWMMAGWESRRRGMYAAGAALMLMAKASAPPLLAGFCLANFALLPAAAWLADGRPRVRRAIARQALRWIAATAVACVPLATWLAGKYAAAGYLLQSENFDHTTRFSAAGFVDAFTGTGYWLTWHRQGVRETFAVALAALAMAAWGHRCGAWRRGAARVLSLMVQAAMFYTFYAFKVELVGRYYAPFCAMAVAAAACAIPMVRGARARRWLAAAMLLNLAIRIDPHFADWIPGEALRGYFRHEGNVGYQLNTQMANVLRLDRNAVRWMEKQAARDGSPTITAVYPYRLYLTVPEAGFLRRGPLKVVPHYSELAMIIRPWDYYFTGPLENRRERLTRRVWEARAVEQPVSYMRPANDWDYKIDVFRARRGAFE